MTPRPWIAIVAGFTLGVSAVVGVRLLSMPTTTETSCRGLDQLIRSEPSGTELIAEGAIVDAEFGLVSADIGIQQLVDKPPWLRQAIDDGWRQSKLTFRVTRREAGSSPDEIFLLAYQPPDGCPGATSAVTDPLFAAALARATLRIWAEQLPIYPENQGWHLIRWIELEQ